MQPVVVGIAGGSGSGKSTIVDAIVDQAAHPVATLSFDSYYRAFEGLSFPERRRVNYDHPNALDIEQFIADLTLLRAGHTLAAPVYSFDRYTRSDDVQLVDPHPVVVVDGILLFVFDEVRALLDLKVFVDVSDAVRTRRRVARDVHERGRTPEHAMDQITRTVRPMHREFVQPSMEEADLVVDGTADPAVSAARVLGRLPAHLHVG